VERKDYYLNRIINRHKYGWDLKSKKCGWLSSINLYGKDISALYVNIKKLCYSCGGYNAVNISKNYAVICNGYLRIKKNPEWFTDSEIKKINLNWIS
jgi:hypothetical protein